MGPGGRRRESRGPPVPGHAALPRAPAALRGVLPGQGLQPQPLARADEPRSRDGRHAAQGRPREGVPARVDPQLRARARLLLGARPSAGAVGTRGHAADVARGGEVGAADRRGAAAAARRAIGRAGSQAADGPARDRVAAARGGSAQPAGSEPGQLRRGEGQPVPEAAGPAGAEGRREGHERFYMVEVAEARDRRGLRPRGLRARAEGDARRHVVRHRNDPPRRSAASRS